MKTLTIVFQLTMWAIIIACYASCSRTAVESATAYTQKEVVAADFDVAGISLIAREPKFIQHEIAGKLANAGYPTHKYSKTFKVGLVRALEQYQYDNDLLLKDASNLGKLCPLTAHALGYELY